MGEIEVESGEIEILEGSISYRRYFRKSSEKDEEPRGAPLIIVHGGPELADASYSDQDLEAEDPDFFHFTLEPLRELVRDRDVVFYEQLAGRGNANSGESREVAEQLVIELDAVRKHFSETGFHLFAHSRGSIIALDYALVWPEGLLSMIFASPQFEDPRIKSEEAAERLVDINYPVLFTCGGSPEENQAEILKVSKTMPHCLFEIFQQSSRLPHLEQEGEYLELLRYFLDRVEHDEEFLHHLRQEGERYKFFGFIALLAVCFSLLIILFRFVPW